MLTEVEATDLPALKSFFEARRINCQWTMRIDLGASSAGITEYRRAGLPAAWRDAHLLSFAEFRHDQNHVLTHKCVTLLGNPQ